jgi:hypothetical protein
MDRKLISKSKTPLEDPNSAEQSSLTFNSRLDLTYSTITLVTNNRISVSNNLFKDLHWLKRNSLKINSARTYLSGMSSLLKLIISGL